MRKQDLQPNPKEIMETFVDDPIDRNKDLVRFIKIIDSINESYSIALDSYWGSGKTFFVKQIKMILDANNKFTYDTIDEKDRILSKWNALLGNDHINSNYHIPIYYDAWANDNDNDPILSIVYQIIQTVGNHATIKEPKGLETAFSIAGDIFSIVIGFNPIDIAKKLKGENPLEAIIQEKSLQERINEFIESLIAEHGERLLIIIDELDRCNPEYAVKLLERIKHYFNNDRVTFLFSVNVAELQHTVKTHYGADFNASRYLDRFFDLRVPLSKPKAELLLKNADYSLMDCIDFDIVMAVYDYYNMQMRDYLKFISVLKRYIKPSFYDNSLELSNTYEIIENVLLPFAWGLMTNDAQKYSDFISGKDDSELINFLLYPQVFKKTEQYIENLFNKPVETTYLERKIELGAKMDYEILYSFYDSFFNSNSDDSIGKCLIRNYERDFFHSTIAQMSKCMIIDE